MAGILDVVSRSIRSRFSPSRRGLLFGSLAILSTLVASACSSDPTNTPAPSPSEDASIDVQVTTPPIVDASLPDHVRIPYDGGSPPVTARVPVHAELVSTRVEVEHLMFASAEMQISGEPFASKFAGRNLANYDRTYLPTDQYILDNGGNNPNPITDLFGFSTAVESYEYSKYHMNIVAAQSTAGISLANGPVTARHAGATSLDRMRARAAELLTAAGTDISGYAVLPAPNGNTLNYLGFQGLWPNFAPFRSFDPAMQPHHEVVKSCTFVGGYGGIPTIGAVTPEYECAYNSLHLTNRDAQVEKVLVPAAIGFATWKEALWSIDFTGRMHDATSNPVNAVADADRTLVGTANNLVLGTDPPGAARGTFIGSTPLEGMWGMLMLADMENAAELLVGSLMTADGTALNGLSRVDASAYDYTSPLRWFPSAVAVTEDGADPFPGVASMSIADASSRSIDYAAVLLGNAMFFGMTDPRNAGIGQQDGLLLTFDGDPFAADDGIADGEDTAHDRAAALLRVAFIDLDRIHADPATGVLVDSATVSSSGTVTRGNTITTTGVAHAIIALRQTLLSLNGAITQYGAADPDPAADAKGILNIPPIHPPGVAQAPTFSARVRDLFVKNATFVRDVLTKSDGSVVEGALIANGVITPSAGPASIESQAAAARALIEGLLVTGDATFRDRARAVMKHMDAAFYSVPARMFRGVEGEKDEIHMTPERFAWLQSSLRETHKILFVDNDPVLGRDALEERIARVNKLFLNGWDDLDGDQTPNITTECLGARMQQAEQALTGELGRDDLGRPTTDRDSDCILEIDDAQTASVLASDVYFHSP